MCLLAVGGDIELVVPNLHGLGICAWTLLIVWWAWVDRVARMEEDAARRKCGK